MQNTLSLERTALDTPASEYTVPMTKGEMESAICERLGRFEQEYMGRGPKEIHAHLIGDLLVVRLTGSLTTAEQHLVQTVPASKGRELVKQIRTQLIESARPLMEVLIEEVLGKKLLSLHHDISTVTGEQFIAVTLSGVPYCRGVKKR